MHCWNALSIYLLTKDNEAFQANRENEVDKINNHLREQLILVGAPGLTTFLELRQIVWRAADIGLQIAQLPFTITPLDLPPGIPFQQKFFEVIDIDDDVGPEELELLAVPVGLVLFPPVVKLEFDSEGKKMDLEGTHVAQATVISKGRAVCHL